VRRKTPSVTRAALIPADVRHGLPVQQAGDKAQAFFHHRTRFPRQAESVTHVSGTKCHLCLGPFTAEVEVICAEELSPFGTFVEAAPL
jgi:hypothetical protein